MNENPVAILKWNFPIECTILLSSDRASSSARIMRETDDRFPRQISLRRRSTNSLKVVDLVNRWSDSRNEKQNANKNVEKFSVDSDQSLPHQK